MPRDPGYQRKARRPFECLRPHACGCDVADDVAPLASIEPFINALPTKGARIIEYPGELGVCLQHLGILIGRKAHAQVWPEITSWLRTQTVNDQ